MNLSATTSCFLETPVRRNISRAFALLATMLCVNFATAAEDGSWTGENVLPTHPSKEITLAGIGGNKPQNYPLSGPWPFRVREEKNGRLRIFDGTHEGWADKSNFVLPRDAVEYFTRRLATKPSDTFALSMRAGAWQEQKEYDRALADYDACIRINPTSTSYNNRGVLWNIKKDHEKAIADLSEALKLDPKSVIARVNRGNAYRDRKDYDNALSDYDEATRLEPRYAPAFYQRGYVLNLKKEYERAIKELTEDLRLDPHNPTAYYERGSAYRGMKDNENAVKDLSEAIRLSPKYAAAYQLRGISERTLKRYADAVRDYEEAIRLSPKFTNAYSAYAWLLSSCPDAQFRNGAKALENAQKAYDLSGKSVSYLDVLGSAHAEAGNFEEAIKCVKQALATPEYEKQYGAALRKRLQFYEQGQAYRGE